MKFTSNLYASVNTMQANQRTEFRKFENLDLALETETEAGIHTHHNISINCLASSQPGYLSPPLPYMALFPSTCTYKSDNCAIQSNCSLILHSDWLMIAQYV